MDNFLENFGHYEQNALNFNITKRIVMKHRETLLSCYDFRNTIIEVVFDPRFSDSPVPYIDAFRWLCVLKSFVEFKAILFHFSEPHQLKNILTVNALISELLLWWGIDQIYYDFDFSERSFDSYVNGTPPLPYDVLYTLQNSLPVKSFVCPNDKTEQYIVDHLKATLVVNKEIQTLNQFRQSLKDDPDFCIKGKKRMLLTPFGLYICPFGTHIRIDYKTFVDNIEESFKYGDESPVKTLNEYSKFLLNMKKIMCTNDCEDNCVLSNNKTLTNTVKINTGDVEKVYTGEDSKERYETEKNMLIFLNKKCNIKICPQLIKSFSFPRYQNVISQIPNNYVNISKIKDLKIGYITACVIDEVLKHLNVDHSDYVERHFYVDEKTYLPFIIDLEYMHFIPEKSDGLDGQHNCFKKLNIFNYFSFTLTKEDETIIKETIQLILGNTNRKPL